jgi:hypothetical protein
MFGLKNKVGWDGSIPFLRVFGSDTTKNRVISIENIQEKKEVSYVPRNEGTGAAFIHVVFFVYAFLSYVVLVLMESASSGDRSIESGGGREGRDQAHSWSPAMVELGKIEHTCVVGDGELQRSSAVEEGDLGHGRR